VSSLPREERILLFRDLQTETAHALLRKAQRRDQRFPQFTSWDEAIAFMHNAKEDAREKDAILRAIFSCRSEDGHPTWGTVLLLFFWPGLLSLFRRTFRYDPDKDERWRAITATFLESVKRLDVERRPDRIASKLMNDTRSYLYEKYDRIWTHQDRQRQQEPGFWKRHMKSTATGHGKAGRDHHESAESVMQLLRKARAAGVLDEHDRYLLIGTILYGKSLADCACEIGLTYEAAKKRRQRAYRSLATRYSPEDFF